MNFDMSINNPARLGMEEEVLSNKVDKFCDYIDSKYGNHLSKEDFYYEYYIRFQKGDNWRMTSSDIHKLDQFDLY